MLLDNVSIYGCFFAACCVSAPIHKWLVHTVVQSECSMFNRSYGEITVSREVTQYCVVEDFDLPNR